MLELSLGSINLTQIPSVGLRFALFSAFLGFGGLCVAMQTRTASHGVDFRCYLPGKLLHGTLSFSIAALMQYLLPAEECWHLPVYIPVAVLVLCISCFFLVRPQNIAGNLTSVRV
jgi:hypothetical protein